jgi:hypothetical protein
MVMDTTSGANRILVQMKEGSVEHQYKKEANIAQTLSHIVREIDRSL